MTNLLLSMLDKVGVPAETLGDSTGRMPIEPLSECSRVRVVSAFRRTRESRSVRLEP